MAFLAPPVKVVSRDEEKEHRKAKAQLKAECDDASLVAKLIDDDPQLLAKNCVFY